MLPGSFNGLNPMLRRCCNRLLAVSLLALALPMAANAQQVQAMPPSVVLVLKLVSATHVEPTTGIVVADNGLVLVPADFVLSGGEIIVLDGGTDIIKHGRPATIAKQPGTGKLALLSVSGLARTGITFSNNALNRESELYLMAFPPAEYIAKGTPPVQVPAKVIQDSPDVQFSVSPSTPLPYVSGPILDACGYLAGVSLTTGPQSLQPGKPALTLFADDLRQALEAMQIILPSASCTYQPLKTVPSANTEEEGKIAAETSGTDQRTSEGDEANLIGPEVYKPFIPQKRLNPFQGATPPQMPVDTAKPSVWLSIPLWLLLLGFISLAAISWKGFMFWRLHKGDFSPASDAAPLQTAAGSMTGKPRSVPLEGVKFPDMKALPEACNGLLVINGLVDTDMRFQRFCAVNTQAINVTIGRSDADININHPVIGRSHARFESHDEMITLSDLGSSSGTFIKDVPCLPGEIMVTEPGDEIILGNIRIHFSIIEKEAGLS